MESSFPFNRFLSGFLSLPSSTFLITLLSVNHCMPMLFSFLFLSSVSVLSAVVSTFGHLSLVRTLEEPGNNRQERLLIGPQRIRVCSRKHSLEEH